MFYGRIHRVDETKRPIRLGRNEMIITHRGVYRRGASHLLSQASANEGKICYFEGSQSYTAALRGASAGTCCS